MLPTTFPRKIIIVISKLYRSVLLSWHFLDDFPGERREQQDASSVFSLWTRKLMVPGQIRFGCATMGTPGYISWSQYISFSGNSAAAPWRTNERTNEWMNKNDKPSRKREGDSGRELPRAAAALTCRRLRAGGYWCKGQTPACDSRLLHVYCGVVVIAFEHLAFVFSGKYFMGLVIMNNE